MRSAMHAFLIVCFSGNLLGAFAQDTTTSGFAVVTLVSGNEAGLVATETLKNVTGVGLDQTVVGPSVLITTASILVPVGPVAENTTAIAVANPSMGSGGVNLILTDRAGGVVLNTIVQLGPHSQFAKYLNEFFATQPVSFSTPLLLTISSEIPIAVVAFNFRGNDFASIPLTSLSTPTPVPIQPLSPASTISTLPGFGLGVAPPPPMPTSTLSTPPTPTIGGTSALVFAQVASGGDWSSDIAIGNTSPGLQTVRIDFFSPDGFLIRSLTDIVIQPLGVFFFSTNPAVGAVQ